VPIHIKEPDKNSSSCSRYQYMSLLAKPAQPNLTNSVKRWLLNQVTMLLSMCHARKQLARVAERMNLKKYATWLVLIDYHQKLVACLVVFSGFSSGSALALR
jgi:hypothetical protein